MPLHIVPAELPYAASLPLLVISSVCPCSNSNSFDRAINVINKRSRTIGVHAPSPIWCLQSYLLSFPDKDMQSMLGQHPANPVMAVKGRLHVCRKLAFGANILVLYSG